jgi:hypothetical protein
MLKPLSKVQLAWYVSILERPEALASRYYEITTYKQGLGQIYEFLMNSFVSEVNNTSLKEIIAFTYDRWKRENLRSESDIELLPIFIKVLRSDFGKRCQLEAAIREG